MAFVVVIAAVVVIADVAAVVVIAAVAAVAVVVVIAAVAVAAVVSTVNVVWYEYNVVRTVYMQCTAAGNALKVSCNKFSNPSP